MPDPFLLAAGPVGTIGLDRLIQWLATDVLEAVLWVLGGAITIRFIGWAAHRYARRIDAEFDDSDMLVRTERAKHQRAVVDVLRWALVCAVIFVVVLMIFGAFGVPISGLVGPGAVLGAALGFGAQRVVQDILAGFFIVTEKQYGYGDVVRLTLTSAVVAEGTVEDVTLRITKVRTSDGEVESVPNGQIIKATNLSKDWARAVVDIPIPSEADIAHVNDVLEDVGKDFFADKRFHDRLLDPPAPLGVIDLELDAITVRMVARTLPGMQFEISRALRIRIVGRLAAEGITVPAGREVQTASAPPATLEESGSDRAVDRRHHDD
ncbi:mechanosensitive ion channel family protein [Gordonia sp. CPCC 205515]|uniref:mechanosensitive ion channel family protein n=1 Tax=Gordonia sp. CPCC 205515 TaxID=3140791 RepID=UPI003AF3A779